MKKIAKTKYYTLFVDPNKNRIYWTPLGFWDDSVDESFLLQKWEIALHMISRGFTILSDATQVRTLPPKWTNMFTDIQNRMVKAGLSASAEVFSKNAILQMQSNRISKKSKMPKEIFSDKQEAERWLDKF